MGYKRDVTVFAYPLPGNSSVETETEIICSGTQFTAEHLLLKSRFFTINKQDNYFQF